MYDFIGTITKVTNIIPVTGKFKEKCTFVVTSERGDDREIAFLLFDQQIEQILKPLELGDKVRVTFTVKSREYQGNYTTNCFAIAVELLNRPKEEDTFRSHNFKTGGSSQSKAEQERKRQDEQRKRQQEEADRRRRQQEQEDRRKKKDFEDFFEQFKQGPKSSTYHDYFSGINNVDDAKKRYRKLSMEHHPDMPGGSTEKMQEINKQYDRWRK